MTFKAKYVFTPEMDAAIINAYLEKISSIKELAGKWNIPPSSIKRRAAHLGVSRSAEPAWSDEEIELLNEFAGLPYKTISKKLKAKWFFRSANSVKIKLRRLKIQRSPQTDCYTVKGLSDCLGVYEHKITAWIRQGLLKAQPLYKKGDKEYRLIHQKDIRNFILQNPLKFDIRRVDQLWFIDLLTQGKICYTATESLNL